MVSDMLRKWAREPLLHFVVLGALIFVGYRWIAAAGPAAPEQIVVTTVSKALGRGATLSGNFESTYDWEGEQWIVLLYPR